MKVAAIYDIHANLPAVEAVLDAILREDVDQVVVGGDIVPGPMPKETVAALFDSPIPIRFIRGNGESDILALHRGEHPTRIPERFRDIMHWVLRELASEQLSVFESWPPTVRVEIPGLGEVLFCHATPRDDNEIFTKITPEQRLRPIFEASGTSVVICGHTHMQFDRNVGGVRVVNAGSVGMPFGNPGAYWALLKDGSVELRHTPYDLAAAIDRIRATGYPGAHEFRVAQPPPASEMVKVFEAAALGDERS